jgi:hypothetical protein
MIVFNETSSSVFVALGYGSCGIGKGVSAGEPSLIIDRNEEGAEVGQQVGLAGPNLAFNSVVLTFPTEAQRDAVHDAIFRFKQDGDGNWYDSAQPPHLEG